MQFRFLAGLMLGGLCLAATALAQTAWKPSERINYIIGVAPGGTVLDPFAGSGTTGQAALNEGFDCILMEAEGEYIADIKRRFGLQDDNDFEDMIGTPSNHVIDYDELIG